MRTSFPSSIEIKTYVARQKSQSKSRYGGFGTSGNEQSPYFLAPEWDALAVAVARATSVAVCCARLVAVALVLACLVAVSLALAVAVTPGRGVRVGRVVLVGVGANWVAIAATRSFRSSWPWNRLPTYSAKLSKVSPSSASINCGVSSTHPITITNTNCLNLRAIVVPPWW